MEVRSLWKNYGNVWGLSYRRRCLHNAPRASLSSYIGIKAPFALLWVKNYTYLDTNLTVFGEDLKRSRMTNLLSSGDLAYNHVRLLSSFAPLQRAAVPAGLLEQVWRLQCDQSRQRLPVRWLAVLVLFGQEHERIRVPVSWGLQDNLIFVNLFLKSIYV